MKKLFGAIKNNWLLLTILLIVIFGGFIYFQKKKNSDKVELTFEQPVRRDLTKTLEVSGIIDANEKATMRFAAGGKVVSLGAEEGQWIKKWQTIATIDRRELEKRLQKDLNNYMKERWDWEQQLDDIEDRTIDERERRNVDKNQWDLENTVLDVEIRDIAIKNTVLSSPIDGILISSPTDVAGVQLMATDSFEIINPNSLVFKGLVDESDIALVKEGQMADVILDAYPEETLKAFVDTVAYKSTETTGGTSFIVEFPLNAQNVAPGSLLYQQDEQIGTPYVSLERYKLGMNGDATIELTSTSNVIAVPLDAVREKDDKYYVDIRSNDPSNIDGFVEQEITVGLETEDYYEVLSGIDESSWVVIPE